MDREREREKERVRKREWEREIDRFGILYTGYLLSTVKVKEIGKREERERNR